MQNNEGELRVSAQCAMETASKTIVRSDDDYRAAATARKEIKDVANKIKEYWAPKKDQAFQLHKSLVAAEKEMLQPLEKADKEIDSRMSDYRKEIERQRQEAERERKKAEEEARKAIEEACRKKEEAQRLADEAASKEELDDEDVEILLMAQQEASEAASVIPAYQPAVMPEVAKVDGVSVRKTWKARIVDDEIVPVSLAGMIIRPVDQSALNRLAVMSKGNLKCPGVEFYQEENTQIRLR